ncbi:hypothetical protein HGRIS_005112 [Hohenbuehelia grisea]|uniref:Uncharacterized protein n=1 Tax=Hohenbuehelia grisea TaxID=104357 RepID=A0ABR3JFG5_9AGAR
MIFTARITSLSCHPPEYRPFYADNEKSTIICQLVVSKTAKFILIRSRETIATSQHLSCQNRQLLDFYSHMHSVPSTYPPLNDSSRSFDVTGLDSGLSAQRKGAGSRRPILVAES